MKKQKLFRLASLLLPILLLSILVACSAERENSELNKLSAEEILELYFESWEAGDTKTMKQIHYNSNASRQEVKGIEKLELQSITESELSYPIDAHLYSGEYIDSKLFTTEFFIEMSQNAPIISLEGQQSEFGFLMVKPSKDEHWIIIMHGY